MSRPTFTDLLPFIMVRRLKSFCLSLPGHCQELVEYLKEKRKEKVESEGDEEDEEDNQGTVNWTESCCAVCI